MHVTIDIGKPHMTRELLEGNPRTLVYTGCNEYSHVLYASWNEDSHVHNSTLRKIYSKLV